MYDRSSLQPLPYPFDDIDTLPEPLSTLDFLPHMHTLLQHTQGLAGVCYSASLHPETAEQDLSQALHVLHGYLEAARGFFERWRLDGSPASPGEGGAPLPQSAEDELHG